MSANLQMDAPCPRQKKTSSWYTSKHTKKTDLTVLPLLLHPALADRTSSSAKKQHSLAITGEPIAACTKYPFQMLLKHKADIL